MTELQKQVLRMMIDEKPMSEIASELGVSRQDVWQIAQRAIKNRARCENRGYKYYPAIQHYMEEHNCTVADLARASGVRYGTLRDMLRTGKRIGRVTIVRLNGATGISADDLINPGGE